MTSGFRGFYPDDSHYPRFSCCLDSGGSIREDRIRRNPVAHGGPHDESIDPQVADSECQVSAVTSEEGKKMEMRRV